ncbi:MAG: type II toxin-antitoxin system Phd/YefM family antitoxin [Gemmatimonadota bacterium]|jgi:antitoxin YefM|nr:type II toxin-antitoxin system Phd/YefM family antitoxin [Gemmatimonadota bacterium]
MSIQTTYTQARAHLAKLCDEVSENREIVIISRRDAADVALIDATELADLMETSHLLRSPKNAQRLISALNRALDHDHEPQYIEALKREVGLEEKTE